jgi:choline dehydrogenase
MTRRNKRAQHRRKPTTSRETARGLSLAAFQRGKREEYEYIVIGTGAGGGPVAANLAKAGKRVLVLEAGGDASNPRSQYKYAVPGSDPRTDPELGWSYWVNSRKSDDDRKAQHFYVPGKGIYYPRGTSIGGSTTVNAMITLYPDNSDWDAIADLTGDKSWRGNAMRGYFERLEAVRYAKPARDNRERHGFKGWLPVEMVGTKRNLFTDPWLANYVVARVRGERNGGRFAEAWKHDADFRVDPNAWTAVNRRQTGLVDPPRSAMNGARRGTRELLLETARLYPRNLTIRTDCLVTSLLFDDTRPTRVIGLEYLNGPHLYGASLLAEIFASRPGARQQVFAAREVMVAAGAFNSPQLLMLSGIGPAEELRRHGISLRVDLPGVGSNLQDRLETGVVCRLPFEPNIYQGCTWGADGDPCLAAFEANAPDSKYRDHLARQMYMVERSSQDRKIPNLVIFGFIGSFRGYYHPSLAPPPVKDAFTWFTLSGHTYNTGGTVRLRTSSPRDTPEINFNYFEDGNDGEGHDLAAILHGVKAARRLAALGADGPAEGEISPGPECKSDDDLKQFIKNEAWGHHASCTNKMGPATDPMAVVDSRFRVHKTERLRVVDASVFPRIPGLFIVVPIYMIAEKASDTILADASR